MNTKNTRSIRSKQKLKTQCSIVHGTKKIPNFIQKKVVVPTIGPTIGTECEFGL